MNERSLAAARCGVIRAIRVGAARRNLNGKSIARTNAWRGEARRGRLEREVRKASRSRLLRLYAFAGTRGRLRRGLVSREETCWQQFLCSHGETLFPEALFDREQVALDTDAALRATLDRYTFTARGFTDPRRPRVPTRRRRAASLVSASGFRKLIRKTGHTRGANAFLKFEMSKRSAKGITRALPAVAF